jgi:hypothetical protein
MLLNLPLTFGKNIAQVNTNSNPNIDFILLGFYGFHLKNLVV